MRAALDKLKEIKADLFWGEGWRDWDFGQLLQAIKCWRDINCDLQVSVDWSESKGKNDQNDGNSCHRPFKTSRERKTDA